MAITVLPDRSIGTKIGTDLGNALSTGLQNLAQAKLQQVLHQHNYQQQQAQQQQQISQRAQGFMLAGLNPQQALGLALSPEAVQKQYFENYGFENPQQQQGFNPQQQEQPSQLSQQLQPLQGLEGKNLMDVFGQLSQQGQPQNLQQLMGQGGFLNQQQPQQQVQRQQQPLTRQGLQQQTDQMKLEQPWQILQKKPIGKVQKELFDDARKQQHEIDKTLSPRIEALDKAANAAKKDDYSYNTLRKAINSGKLTNATYARTMSAITNNSKSLFGGLGATLGTIGGAIAGTIIPGVGTFAGATAGGGAGASLGTAIGSVIPKFVGSPLDQTFNKTVYGFLRNAKDFFGSNIAVKEMDALLETLPTLHMDNSAKLAVIDQMEGISKLAIAQDKAKNDIIKEHGGYAPANLFELIDKRTESQYKKTAQDLNATIERLIGEEGIMPQQRGLSTT